MPFRNVAISDSGERARDIMLTAPETVTDTTTVAAARRLLENPRLRTLLVTRGPRLIGVVSRRRLADEPDDNLPLSRLADAKGPRIGPDEPLARVLERLETTPSGRIPVVEKGDRLIGLICLNRRQQHFCVDATTPPARGAAGDGGP